MTKTPNVRLHTPRGVACFVNLHTPRPRIGDDGVPTGKADYGLLMFFAEGTDLSALEEAAEAAALAKFGAKWEVLKRSGKLRWPFRDAQELEDSGPPFDTPGTCINFKSEDRPGVVDADAMPLMEKSDCYSGMEARVSCRVFAYDNRSKGVSFALVNVQKLGDGERLSGNPDAESDFAAKPARNSSHDALM
jgi:hypothetical protein